MISAHLEPEDLHSLASMSHQLSQKIIPELLKQAKLTVSWDERIIVHESAAPPSDLSTELAAVAGLGSIERIVVAQLAALSVYNYLPAWARSNILVGHINKWNLKFSEGSAVLKSQKWRAFLPRLPSARISLSINIEWASQNDEGLLDLLATVCSMSKCILIHGKYQNGEDTIFSLSKLRMEPAFVLQITEFTCWHSDMFSSSNTLCLASTLLYSSMLQKLSLRSTHKGLGLEAWLLILPRFYWVQLEILEIKGDISYPAILVFLRRHGTIRRLAFDRFYTSPIPRSTPDCELRLRKLAHCRHLLKIFMPAVIQ